MSTFLFLDIDGVLSPLKNYHPDLSLEHVRRLKQLLARFEGVRIVLSSTWRFYPDLLAGVEQEFGRVLRTPDILRGSRGDEIAAFLKNFPDCRYVIVDDNSDMLECQKPFFVQTNGNKGLQPSDVRKIERILTSAG